MAKTKAEIINAYAENTGMSRSHASTAIDAVFDMVTIMAKKEGEFRWPGFGSFKLQKRKARKGRNPATGETIKIAASKTIAFKPSKVLKESL